MCSEVSALLAGSSDGDSNAFCRLYEPIYGELYRYALYCTGVREDAEDCLQETALNVWKNIGRIRSCDNFRAYFYRALRNCCLRTVKSRRAVVFEPYELIADSVGTTDESRSAFELWSSLSCLSADERTIISLSIAGGFTSAEISHILSRPAATVRSTLSRALKKLNPDDFTQ